MYARLSPETVSFINRGVVSNNDLNYREALSRYSDEITCAIKEVCLELSKEDILDNDWSVSIEDEDEVDEQIQLTISGTHSRNFFRLQIDREQNCTWSYHCPRCDSSMLKNLQLDNNSFKRYFKVNMIKGEGIIIQTSFSKRQLISRHLVDYIMHLTRQLSPVMDSLCDPIHAVAA